MNEQILKYILFRLTECSLTNEQFEFYCKLIDDLLITYGNDIIEQL